MAKAKRQVFHSSFTKTGWQVSKDKRTVSEHGTQADAEAAAINAARKVYDDGGLSQVVFHKEDGVIKEERTYGKDPERTPG